MNTSSIVVHLWSLSACLARFKRQCAKRSSVYSGSGLLHQVLQPAPGAVLATQIVGASTQAGNYLGGRAKKIHRRGVIREVHHARLYAHGGMLSTLTKLSSTSAACIAINRFVKQSFPLGNRGRQSRSQPKHRHACIETSKT